MSLMKKETEEQRLTRCKKRYGCDGQCYNKMDECGNLVGMCGAIDICNETRKSEEFANILIVICMIILFPFYCPLLLLAYIMDGIRDHWVK